LNRLFLSNLDPRGSLSVIVLRFSLGIILLGAISCSQKQPAPVPGKAIQSKGSGTQISAADSVVKVGPATPGKPKLRDRRSMAYGLTTRASLQGLKLPLDRTAPGAVTLTRIWPTRTFSRPTFLTYAPDGSHRIFVLGQYGVITVMHDAGTTSTGQTFLDIRTKVWGSGERGLLGLAFDPDFSKNGYFYIYYSISNPHRSVIARYTVSATNPNQADPKSEKILLVVAQPRTNHNGGMLAFGPDRMLYIALGDGGSYVNTSQNTSNLLGSILRIDPRASTGYSIPRDNPFVGKTGYRPEIWAYGLRNPWRFSFDRQNGRLWCADVGASTWEEVDIIEKGGNYAWPFFEGNRSYRNPGNRKPSEFNMPVIDVARGLARSITGGYVYRGSKLASLRGAYVYGDYATGRIWALVYDQKSKKVVSNTQIASLSSISSFGEDRDGEIYVLSLWRGRVYRVERKGVSNPGGKIPAKLSLTGLFSDTARLIPNPGLIEYDVNAPLWSDGATKRRWIGIPDNTKIQVNPDGALLLPTGSTVVQQFYLDTGASAPTRVETRVLIHEKQGWAGYTYRWNAAQTDADLAYDGGNQTYKVKDATAQGGFRNQIWNFPSSSDCMSCHSDAGGSALGIRYSQLNKGFQYSKVEDNQLRAWNNIGLFSPSLAESRIHELPAHEDPYGNTGTLEQRARAYLDVNCASCHLPMGPAPGSMDMRSQTGAVDMNLFGVKPSEGGLGLSNPHRILSGTKESSVLWERMRRTDGSRMPELGSTLVDKNGVQLIGSWIDSLK
jgi:uncharacterized repeat protein (TIGR03806 family)